MADKKANRSGYNGVTAYLICKNAMAAIAYYKTHFGATERLLLQMPDGSLAHGEIIIADTCLMIAEENVAAGITSPLTLGNSSVSLTVYVEDADSCVLDLKNSGSDVLEEVRDQFHGDRSGKIRDPFGHIWHVSSNVTPMSPEEIIQSFKDLF